MVTLPSPGLLASAPSSSGLPDIVLQRGESLYVLLNYPGCGWGPNSAELYAGTKERHDRLIAKVELPDAACNILCRFFGYVACFWPANLKLTTPDGASLGSMQLGRAWSRICWWPYLSVNLGGEAIGTVQKKCCLCTTCIKDVTMVNGQTFTSKKFIMNKLLYCFIGGCWNLYRTFLKNRTQVEYYTLAGDETADAFEVINDVDMFACFGCGCIKHFEIAMLGREFVGSVKPATYMLAFAAGILEGFQGFT